MLFNSLISGEVKKVKKKLNETLKLEYVQCKRSEHHVGSIYMRAVAMCFFELGNMD